MRRVSGSSPLSSTIYPVVFRYQEQKPANFAGFLLFRRNFPHFCTENAPIWGAIFFFQKVCWICCGSPRRARRMRLSPGSPLPDLSPLPDRRPGSFPRQGPPPRGPYATSVAQRAVEFIPFLSHFCPTFVPDLSHFCPTFFSPDGQKGRIFKGFCLFSTITFFRGPGRAQRSGSAGERRSKGAERGRPAEARTGADFATTWGEGLGAAESRKPS